MGIGNRWQGTYRMVPDSLWQHPDLAPTDSVVWCALCLVARDRGQLESSNRGLAAAARVSPATFKRSLARLAATGFVRVEGETTRRVLHLCPDAVVSAYTLRIAN
jgi:hypothetical protein